MPLENGKLSIVMIGQKGIPVGIADAGGVERHVEELAVRLAEQGHKVTVFVRPRFQKEAVREYRGVTLRRLPCIETRSLDAVTHSLVCSLAAVRMMPDIIHYHGVGPSTMAWIPRLFASGSRVVATLHSIDRMHPKWGFMARAYLRFGEWACLRFPHATISVSQSNRAYGRAAYGRDSHYIPNGADEKPYPGSDLLARWGLVKDGYFLTVARLVEQKGIHHLIKAYDGFERFKKLVIVGAGAPKSEYAAHLKSLSEGNSAIVFTGFQSGQALDQLFANAYLYVHPSEAEGLSVSILEAMAAGRCTLVSDIPENVESVDHSGLTFVNADEADLREKLEELVNHPEIVAERGEKCRRWVRQQFDWNGIVRETERLYLKLIQG